MNAYRLGHMPLSGRVTIKVLDAHTRKVLASERVTLAAGGAWAPVAWESGRPCGRPGVH